MIQYAVFTDNGSREINEDRYGVAMHGDSYCFAVADGLGGHGNGEIAAQAAVDAVCTTFVDEGFSDSFFKTAFFAAQDAILHQQEILRAPSRMKTTLVVLVLHEGKAMWAHVGDTRLYSFKQGKMRGHTIDHSVPQMLVVSGEIEEKDIRHHPDRNRLMRVMGIRSEEPRFDASPAMRLHGDNAYLLCTDGFWELIEDADMMRLHREALSPETWLSEMSELIRKNGEGSDMDNYTAIGVYAKGKSILGEVAMKDDFVFVDLRKSGRYDIAFRTGIGRRDTQQDAGYTAACDDEVLAVVCDGMGGMRGGELASEAAVERFLEEYEKNGQSGSAWMEEAIELVDDKVYSLKAPDGNRLGAGTTLVAAHVINDSVSWVSAGDSRLYIIRAGQLVQITTDHNYLFQLDGMLESGEIDSERYRIEAQDGEALISYAGMGGLQWKDISRTPLKLAVGDTLLICSDGLYRSVPDEKLLAAVCASQTMEDTAVCLEHELRAAAQPEQDNYTYILIHLNEGERL